MMKLLMMRKAHGVVLHKVDRGARNLADWAKFAELADAGIDVHFATESLDFRSRGGRLTADIQAVIAADYIRNLREECIKGIDGRLKQGLYPFKAPLGYQDNGGGKVKSIDPVLGPLVREAFELYASGEYSLRSLPHELARRGLRNVRGNMISKVGLEKMLANPFYYGIIKTTRHGATHPGVHEPLISPSLFVRVQNVRAGRTAKKVTKLNHLYHGLFTCCNCGTSMVPERQKGHVYYRCHTKGCNTKTIREETISECIVARLDQLRFADAQGEWLQAEFEKWIETRKAKAATSTVPMQLTKVQERINRLTDTLLDGIIDEETYRQKKAQLLEERARLEEEQRRPECLPDTDTVQKFLELVKSLAQTYRNATDSEKRQIIQFATSNRTVCGRNAAVEPSDWLSQTTSAIAGLLGGDYRPTPRMSCDDYNSKDRQLRGLLGLIHAFDEKGAGGQSWSARSVSLRGLVN